MRAIRATATRSVLAAFLLVMAGAFVAPASAAPPSKVDSSPQEGDELHEAPERVSISFDQPLDPDSYIHVENHCGARVDEQPTEVNGTDMSVPVTGNWSGMYHVTYFSKGLGGVTGQETGTFTFSVHAGEGCDGDGGGHEHGAGGKQGGGHEGGGHNGGRQHNSGTGNHGERGHSSPAHEGAAHRSTTHASSHGTDSSSGMGHGDHGVSPGGDSVADHSGMDHSGHSGGDTDDGADHIRSAPVGSSGSRPGSEAVVVSLSLCALLGVLGGAVLRFSAPN